MVRCVVNIKWIPCAIILMYPFFCRFQADMIFMMIIYCIISTFMHNYHKTTQINHIVYNMCIDHHDTRRMLYHF